MIDAGQLHLAELLLSIAGFLILFLLGIIGFWIQKWIRSTDALTEALNNLKILFAGTKATVDEIQKHCDHRCKSIDDRLEDQTRAIHKNITEIAVISLKLKLNED